MPTISLNIAEMQPSSADYDPYEVLTSRSLSMLEIIHVQKLASYPLMEIFSINTSLCRRMLIINISN